MKKLFVISALLFLTGCSSSVSFYDTYKTSKYDTEKYVYSDELSPEVYASFFDTAKIYDIEDMRGGIIPRDITAGNMIASFFATLRKLDPSMIVFVSATTTTSTDAQLFSYIKHYETVDAKMISHEPLIKTLRDKSLIHVIEDDSAIYPFVPFFAHYVPHKMVLPLLIPMDISVEQMDILITELRELLPDDSAIIMTMNASQNLPYYVANFHDELNMHILSTMDMTRINDMEIDNPYALQFTMKLLQTFHAEHTVQLEHENSAVLDDTMVSPTSTGYITAYIARGVANRTRMASMLNVGDIMLDRNVAQKIAVFGTDYILEKLAGSELRFFHGVDIVAGNLEGPFANYRRDTTKSIAFRFDPALLSMLKKYNFSLFTLANNHTLDMSRQSFAESKAHLAKAGFDYYGDQFNLTNESLLTKEIGAMKFAYIGINDTHDSVTIDDMVALVQSAENNHDHTIVNIHWGQEYAELRSNARQQNIAHRLIDAGADLIIGHHPHVIQEMEIYNNRPIFYSLGNFVFDQYFSTPTQQTLAVGTVFHDTDSISLYIIPIESQNSQNKHMDYETAKNLMQRFESASRLGNYTIQDNHITINF